MDASHPVWASPEMTAARAAGNLGGIVRLVRQAAGLTLAQVAARLHCSVSTLSRLETGRQPLTNTATLRLLARHLSIPEAMLGLAPPQRSGHRRSHGVEPLTPALPSVTVSAGDVDSDENGNPMRRRTFMAAAGLSVPLQVLQRFDDALAVPPAIGHPEELPDIQRRLQAARRQYDVSDLVALMTDLPDLLAAAKDTADRVDTPAGWALLATSYALATDTLSKVGRDGSARLTADRAMLFAERSGDAVAMAAAARPLGMMLRKEGRFGSAAAVVARVVDQLEAAGLRTPAQASSYVRLMCAASYTASWAGDRERALERIGETEQAVTRLSALTGQATMPFVRLYRANISYALGDAGMALHVMRDLTPAMYPTPERRARLHTDRARALWQWGKPEATAQALLAAFREAPGEVRDRPSHRQIAEDLAARYPRVSGVRELTAAISR